MTPSPPDFSSLIASVLARAGLALKSLRFSIAKLQYTPRTSSLVVAHRVPLVTAWIYLIPVGATLRWHTAVFSGATSSHEASGLLLHPSEATLLPIIDEFVNNCRATVTAPRMPIIAAVGVPA